MQGLFSKMHYLKWYNGTLLELEENETPEHSGDNRATSYIKGWAKDYSTKLVGVPRLRQLRVSMNWSGEVSPLFTPWYGYRVGSLNIFNHETKPFRPGWEHLPRYHEEPPVWAYETYNATESIGMFGHSGLYYRKGGYVELMHTNKGNSDRKFIKIFMNDWVDNYTRVIFLEANLYNVNSNLLSVITIIFEHLPNGVYLTRANVEAAYLMFQGHDYNHLSVTIVTMLLFLIILIIIALKSVILISLFGIRNFFNNWWTICDALIIFSGILMLIEYLRSIVYFHLYTELLEKDKSKTYTSYYLPLYSLFETYILVGILAILIAMKCSNFMRFIITYSLLAKAFHLAAKFLITIFLLFIFFEILLQILATIWNYPLFYKYIMFPIYKNYYMFKDKNNFHHRDYFPILFAYLFVILSTLAAVILIQKYKKTLIMFEETKRISKNETRIPYLTLKALTSEKPYRRGKKNKGLKFS